MTHKDLLQSEFKEYPFPSYNDGTEDTNTDAIKSI
jgi:hypothetical protein